MRLKDEIVNRKRRIMIPHKGTQKQANLEKNTRYDLILRIRDRLARNIKDYNNVYYSTCEEIFDEIEKRNIDVSDIVDVGEYVEFKKQILEDNVMCPYIGKLPESKLRQATPNEYKAYLRTHPDMRFLIKGDVLTMGLRERIKNRKPIGTEMDIDEYLSSEKGKRYQKFLQICNRLQKTVDLSDIYCSTYEKVFELIEQHHVDITDIVPENEYGNFKDTMLKSRVRCCPTLGKDPERIYDLNNKQDRLDYMRLHKDATI